MTEGNPAPGRFVRQQPEEFRGTGVYHGLTVDKQAVTAQPFVALGAAAKPKPHEGNRALRIGDYKLVSAREDHDQWELFDLATDRCEQHNLAAAQSGRVREMAARWQQLQDEFSQNPGPVLPAPKAAK